MHEYRLHPSLYETIPSYETEEIILCRIQHKGRGAADKSDGATEQVAWMTAAPAIQGAMADVFGCYRVPDTGVLGKEPSCGGTAAAPEAWTCDDIFGFYDDLDLAAEATFVAATSIAPPATEPWRTAPPATHGATADVAGEESHRTAAEVWTWIKRLEACIAGCK
ncbi:hypothetical protein MUK42_16433 [Musa troglodytarum]|uniref:Uncharacterized protein n=1 Tax=Musa troglodytarum TaxID=320322 RepID=A0A9E7F863_9LILI|nr:hypothetical protein MUK42_16433 [Musa troglodytarum]